MLFAQHVKFQLCFSLLKKRKETKLFVNFVEGLCRFMTYWRILRKVHYGIDRYRNPPITGLPPSPLANARGRVRGGQGGMREGVIVSGGVLSLRIFSAAVVM